MSRRAATTTNPSPLALAAGIRAARRQLGLSQGQFAQKIGNVSQQMVSDWERGKRLRALIIAFRLRRILQSANTIPAD